MQLRFHAQTAGVSLTAQQPELNIARTALEALAAVLGGTQSLHTNSYDEALALPTDPAARLARRTQQIIAEETGVAHVADPLGGSWFVESLTDDLEGMAEELLGHIDRAGGGSMLEGAIALTEEGWYQSEIADASFAFERKLHSGRRRFVGVNAYREGNEDDDVELLRITADTEAAQVKSLARVRADRDGAAVAAALSRLAEAARGGEGTNLMPVLIDTVRTYATLGEITATLKSVYGGWTEAPRI